MAIKIGEQLEGKAVVDQYGTQVGKIDQVMRKPGQEPEWARVKLGRFGVKSAWMPLGSAEISGDAVRVPFDRQQIEEAHDVAGDDRMSPDQVDGLQRHYTQTPVPRDDQRDDQPRGDTETDDRAMGTTAAATTTGRTRDDRMRDDRMRDESMRDDRLPDVDTVRAHQRDEFGGINWGSAFFGWLVAMGLATILMSIFAAAGAGLGLGDASAETLSIGGAIAFLVSLAIAYYAGGYVAGRMSRFDGVRQGAAVWAWGLILTLLAALAGWILGSEYNILQQLNLPRIPVDEGTLATGAGITLAATVLVTLLSAMVGGKVGERYHERVDETTFPDRSRR